MNAATEAEKKEDVKANVSEKAKVVKEAAATNAVAAANATDSAVTPAPNASTGIVVNINTGKNTTRKKNSSNSTNGTNTNGTRNTKSVKAGNAPAKNANANANNANATPNNANANGNPNNANANGNPNNANANGNPNNANSTPNNANANVNSNNANANVNANGNPNNANANANPNNANANANANSNANANANRAKLTSSELTIPFDNFDRYNTVWKMCKMELSKFKPIADQNKGSDLSVVEDPESPGKFTLKSPTADVLKVLSPLEVLKQLNLFRYRDLLEATKTKEFSNTLDFFHEVEANREYHSRACLALCCLEEGDVTVDDVKDLKVSNLEVMDRKVFEQNKSGKPFSPYELTFLVNPLMVTLAQWEVDAEWLGSALYQEKYTNAILTDKNFPAHLILLSKYVENAKETVMKKYPESLLMNYAYFYPLILTPTGDEPAATQTTEPEDESVTSSNNSSQ